MMKKIFLLLFVTLFVSAGYSHGLAASDALTSAERFPAPLVINQEKMQDSKVTLYIPYISGMKDIVIQHRINEILRRDIDANVKEWNKSYGETYAVAPPENREGIHFWQTYAVKYNKDNMFSITEMEYNFTGGAHGNALLRAYTINAANAKVYSLADLFDSKKDWRGALNSYIKNETALRGANYSFSGIAEQQTFYVTEEGLVIYFQPYEIGSWADGIVRFVIPFSYISEYFAPSIMLY